MPKKHDLTGKKFGRLLVLGEAPGPTSRNSKWRVQCSCSTITVVRGSRLVSGQSKSCGCLARELSSARNATHGKSKTPEYAALIGARERCENPRAPQFHHYGGRGIRFSPEFDPRNGGVDRLIAEIGPRPARGYTLDRKDNDGNYEPGNVRWADKAEQAHNTRRTKLSTEKVAEIRRMSAAGVSDAQLAERFHVSRALIYRVNKGLTWVATSGCS